MLSVIHADYHSCWSVIYAVSQIKPFLLSVIMLNVVDAASQIKPFMLNVVMLNAVAPIKPQRGFNVRFGEFTNFLPFRKDFLKHGNSA
jgi:hypothetical protein